MPPTSGGPLFNMSGKVVGITTSHTKGKENLNFAIPINDVKPMLLARSPRARALPDEAEPVTAEQTTGPSDIDFMNRMVAPEDRQVILGMLTGQTQQTDNKCTLTIISSMQQIAFRDLKYLR